MKYTPRVYQEMGRRFLIDHKQSALFEDMGLGKTVQVLTAFSDLQVGLDAHRMLIIAPIRVCESVWPEEIKQWDHTNHLTSAIVRGSPVSRVLQRHGKEFDSRPSSKAVDALATNTDITLTNYENLPALCEWMAQQIKARIKLPWDWLVFDESTKMKNNSSRRFKLLKPFLHRFKRWTIMSGTPMPNSYLDLWAQFYLIDRGDRLGDRFTHFRDRWFDYNPWSYQTTIKVHSAKEIEKLIAPAVLCLRSEDWIKLPPVITTRIVIDLPPKVRKQYDEFEKEMFVKLEAGEVEAFNAASVSGKCRQLTSGAVYETTPEVDPDRKVGGREGPRRWHLVGDWKMDAVEEIVDSAQGDPTLIVYEFKHELARLQRIFRTAPYLGGGAKESAKTVQRWNLRKLPILLAHPDSMAHGLNLQSGGRRIIWTSMTWNADLYAQTIKRLHRSGQARPVLVYRLVCRATVDEAVEAALAGKAGRQEALLAALRAYRQKRAKE